MGRAGASPSSLDQPQDMVVELFQCGKSKKLDDLGGCLGIRVYFYCFFSEACSAWAYTGTDWNSQGSLGSLGSLGSCKLRVIQDHRALWPTSVWYCRIRAKHREMGEKAKRFSQ